MGVLTHPVMVVSSVTALLNHVRWQVADGWLEVLRCSSWSLESVSQGRGPTVRTFGPADENA